MFVVVVAELEQLHLQIDGGREQQSVQTFAPDRSYQSLDERMRPGNLRNRFDFRDTENSKVGLPLVKPIQRIMVRTQIPRNCGDVSDSMFEHSAQRFPIHGAGIDSKSDDSTGILIHYQYPMRSQNYGLATK
jgi:hypothetical protein